MKYFAIVASISLVMGVAVIAPAQEKSEHKYVGVSICKLCHSDNDTGNQVEQWKKSKHSEAFKVLSATEQKDAKCIKCHTTGAEAPKERKGRIKEADGVSCESCHGPGGDYAKEEIFKKGKEAAIASGLVIPDEKTCIKCHNQESPHFKGFDYKSMVEKIKHPRKK